MRTRELSRPPRTISVAFVHLAALPSVASTVERHGYSATKLFGRFGVSIEEVNVIDGFMPAANYLQLLEAAAQYTGDPSFGISCTIDQPFNIAGALGYLATSLPSLLESWHALQPFVSRLYSYKYISYTVEGNVVELHCSYCWSNAEETYQSGLRSAVYMLKLLRFFSPEASQFAVVLPAHMASAVGSLEALGVSVRAEGQQVTLRVSRADAERRQPNSDQVLGAILIRYLRQTTDTPSRLLLISQLEHEIRSLLKHGTAPIQAVAARLNVSVRELNKKLSDAGGTWADLVERCRFELACHYLRSEDHSIGEISSLLGYANQSAFTRAFSRWSGMSPRQFRARPKGAFSRSSI
ncbi:helix-turn-helix domain-containing protein [Chelatococcus sp. GCM10030263]|uniref:AraC family transcriptional regulator n=1 Tax=Chelatococcus sp. GCM10030263 TaxID=3273387 RepID=UPI0036188F94